MQWKAKNIYFTFILYLFKILINFKIIKNIQKLYKQICFILLIDIGLYLF